MAENDQKKPKKPKAVHEVFTLLVEVGRKENDGLPKKATGAGLLCFASGVDEAEAVRETVAVLKQADLAPLDVTGYGSLAEREAQGDEISDEERELMERARAENSVVVVQMTPFYDDGKTAGGLDPADA
ncbi:hypothetical protein KUL25_16760 [Rhodobacteraceae bacterium N5(2021)]|uniref:Uncharacterized protein n=1 Tax=Gymnodinialimonas phycosphaerae TaxID=2841589 RepID=A0A975TTP2_9RHOB|nr:hypothetical protein [Gymnodinialimonas phycosphaerae]MBY4894409.1 hypothetical protein [Gymnodinialimonas phycosphaerae]